MQAIIQFRKLSASQTHSLDSASHVYIVEQL
jgi:hypothetical protein